MLLPFVSQEQILCCRDSRNQGQLLMDNDNPLFLAVLETGKAAYLTVIQNIPAVGSVRIDPAENIHQCGFACAVFAADCMDLSPADRQIHIVKSLDAEKFFCDMLHFNDIICHWLPPI